jgi:hypothetical protein
LTPTAAQFTLTYPLKDDKAFGPPSLRGSKYIDRVLLKRARTKRDFVAGALPHLAKPDGDRHYRDDF